jgi:dihydrolipoamide dehydrogenase
VAGREDEENAMTHILVLGGGPAGYIAAGRAAQLGADVTLVEQDEIGGTCLNRGCIPTKAMIAGADRLRSAREAGEFGIRIGDIGLDFPAFMARKDRVAATLRGGVEHILAARKVEVMHSRATLAGPGRLTLAEGEELRGDAVVLATGSQPIRLGVFDWSDPRVMTSDELLNVSAVPATLVIVGGGVIGCEFASLFATLGSSVTIVELLDQLVPGEPRRVAHAVQQSFKKRGVELLLGTAVAAVERAGDQGGPASDEAMALRLSNGRVITAATVLVAVGRRPVSAGLGFEEAGVRLDDHGFVVVDESLRTTADGVFAAGDVTGQPMLAHWAYHQGAVAAENAVTGSRLKCDRRVIPAAMFGRPEIASCGLSEEHATSQGLAVKVAHVRINANSKAVIEGEADGFVRITCDASSGRILGASVVGPHASELIHELALATHARLSLDELASTIHAHPTLSEAIAEAGLSSLGRAAHSL